MKKGRLFLRYGQICLVAVMFVFALGTNAYAAESKLSIEKSVFQPGEEIRVDFVASPNFAANAWVGIIPSNIQHGSESVNDQHDIAYLYLNKRTRGTLVFHAPTVPGAYDLRMNDSDNNGKEVCYVSFRVQEGRQQGGDRSGQKGYRDSHVSAKLSVDRTTVRPGEEIRVTFTAPGNLPNNAWIGIVPANITHGSESVNDQHDIAYQYLNGRTSGVMTFTAPSQAGDYDLRLNDSDNNGKELTYVTFKVQESRQQGWDRSGQTGHRDSHVSAKLSVDRTTVRPGEEIRVTFTAPGNLPNNAWIGIVPANITHGSESVNDQHDIAYQYLNGRTSGVMTFTAPSKAGTYDFRLNDSDNNGKELTYVTFKVGY